MSTVEGLQIGMHGVLQSGLFWLADKKTVRHQTYLHFRRVRQRSHAVRSLFLL